MKYVPPGLPGSIVSVEPRYENFIGGKWLAPTHGKYRVDLAPATAGPITEVADSTPEDVELALDAAHAAKDAWGEASATERAKVLNAIADAIEKNQDMLAVAESWENGKPVRETLAADIPLVVDHFRYFAAAARAEEGRSTEIEKDLVAYHFREPLGVVGQIIPFNFPLLMAAWKLAPALAAGQLLGDQACLADALVDPETDGDDRGRPAAGRDQRRDRSRRGDRQGAGSEPAYRKGVLYR
jgi:aldehyde dehydrogenase